jgi:hypothetical protein
MELNDHGQPAFAFLRSATRSDDPSRPGMALSITEAGNRSLSMRMPMKSLLVIVGTVLLGGVASAQPKDYKPAGPQVVPALDKVAMTAFVCEPSPIPPGTAQVTLRVTIKNVTGGLQGVTLSGLKIRVLRTNPQPDVLELETTVNNLAPGASQTVGAHVNVGPGTREYFARVDPDDILHEPIVQRANNESRLKLTIPQALGQQAPAAPQKETQLLDYDKAKRAGAQFGASLEPSSSSPASTLCIVQQQQAPGVGVSFSLQCTYTGGRSNPEAYVNFRLKNGWKVKSYDVLNVTKFGSADWQWTRTPVIGSDDASSKVHLWADPLGQLFLSVKIEIEGPAGTNPYQ